MLISMTGFGFIKKENAEITINISLRSYNSRYLTMEIQLPREYSNIESRISAKLKKNINRGRLICNVSISEKIMPNEISVDWQILSNKIALIREIQQKHNISSTISISDLIMSDPPIFSNTKPTKKDRRLTEIADASMDEVIALFQKTKIAEGEKIYTDLKTQLFEIEKEFDFIKQHKDRAAQNAAIRLKTKLKEFQTDVVDDARFIKELTIFLDRLDITEELNRFAGFLKNLKDVLDSEEKLKGRRLDFIIQEMIREINTMGSKANDLDISKSCINIKAEIEKIREQVQNIE